MTMRYGVQYHPDSKIIEAGAVRAAGDREVFILKSDVTGQVLGATALWLIGHVDRQPFRITDTSGNVYELTARRVVE